MISIIKLGILFVHNTLFLEMDSKMCFNVTVEEDCMTFE